MNYGKHYQRSKFTTIAIIVIAVLHLVSCSSERRLSRLLRNNPQLVKTEIRDSIVIVPSKEIDTFVVLKETHDTIQYAGVSIVRFRDSFRIIGRTQPCTTIIKQYRTTIGSDTNQRNRMGVRNKRGKSNGQKTEKRSNSPYRYFLILSLIANAYLLMTNLVLRYLNKQKDA